MPIEIVRHSNEYVRAVESFNQRMREGGSKWGFFVDPVPDWIPPVDGAKTWREYHLAVEDGETVRGGYAIKPQQWLINGQMEWVTDWQGPFTEAAIDVKFSPLMLRLMRRMQKDHPLLFGMGFGGTDEPIVGLLRKMGWGIWGVPFVFHVVRPFAFLRRNRYLRGSVPRRLLLDVLAYTGLGWLGLKLVQGIQRLVHWKRLASVETEVVDSFGDWADELWEAHKNAYACLAVRDRDMMNTLMPQTGWPGGTRLKVTNEEGTLGWVVVHHKALSDDERFGSLHVGLISDCFAAPDDSAEVLGAANAYLSSQNVDMVFANLTHYAWLEGLKRHGYLVLADRRLFAMSPDLEAKLTEHEGTRQGLHLTNMDGHGPHGIQ